MSKFIISVTVDFETLKTIHQLNLKIEDVIKTAVEEQKRNALNNVKKDNASANPQMNGAIEVLQQE